MSKENNMEYEGKLITGKDGVDGGRVYLVENGKKRWITSPEVIEKLGLRWENIKKVSNLTLKSILTGTPIGITHNDIRFRITAPFLKGHGIEIGAGLYPQSLPEGVTCEYYDKRNEKELAELFNVDESSINEVYSLDQFNERFPDKADFLIAHNVLEHCSDPISTLMEWNSYVKSGGIIVLSVPDSEHCPDKGRNIPPFEHILSDFLLERNDDSFESREHIYSFCMGWIDSGGLKAKDKFEVAENTHKCAKAEKNDLHWHTFDDELLKKTVMASAFFSNKSIKIELIATPINLRTKEEILCIYRILNNKKHNITDKDFLEDINEFKKKLIKAFKKLKILEREKNRYIFKRDRIDIFKLRLTRLYFFDFLSESCTFTNRRIIIVIKEK